MIQYIAKRILLAGFTLWVISLLTFVVMQLPEGDYVTQLLREAQKQAGDDARGYEKQIREFLRLGQAGVRSIHQVDLPDRDQGRVRPFLRQPQ